MDKLTKFEELGLTERTLDALKKKGFEEPSPIQSLVIPALLKGTEDVVGQAQTGTGKTAAFGLPMIELLEPATARTASIQAMVLVPTRELAIQVAAEINSLKGSKDLKIMPVYGGQSMDEQLRKLKHGVDIVVGTPGRVQDHMRRRTIKLDAVRFMVLDEADEMLNMGFFEEIESILKEANPGKRMLLFSATMPDRILQLAKNFMGTYRHLSVQETNQTVRLTEQIYFEVRQSDRFETLCRMVDVSDSFYGLVFCRTRNDVDDLTAQLLDRGYEAAGLHGDISQGQREKILEQFKKKNLNILVATDVASRGIDVQNLSHVINYSLPQNPEDYVHRIGRTGRAGKQGTAITFITPNEYRKLVIIKNTVGSEIKKGKIPAVKDIIKIKQSRLHEELEAIITNKEFTDQLDFASEILLNADPREIVAALLKQNFSASFDPSSYNEISEVSPDRSGTTRLELRLGRNSGMTPASIVEHITSLTGVEKKKIKEVSVGAESSFVTVPFAEAKIMMEKLAATKAPASNRSYGSKSGGRSGSYGGRSGGGSTSYSGKSGGRNSSYGGRSGSKSESFGNTAAGHRNTSFASPSEHPARSERTYKPRSENSSQGRTPRLDKNGEPYKPRKISNESSFAPHSESSDGPFKKFERKTGVRKQDGMPERKPRKKD